MRAKNKLTVKQRRVYDFIVGHIAKEGFQPTHEEIRVGLGFKSPNASVEHLSRIEAAGFIERVPGHARGIRVLERAAQ